MTAFVNLYAIRTRRRVHAAWRVEWVARYQTGDRTARASTVCGLELTGPAWFFIVKDCPTVTCAHCLRRAGYSLPRFLEVLGRSVS